MMMLFIVMNHINQFVLTSSSHSNYILLYILCNNHAYIHTFISSFPTNWP